MSDSLLLPALRRLFADLERRVAILERRASGTAVSAADSQIIFSYAGALTASESPPVLIRHNAVLSVLAVALGTAGSTSTTLAVKRNGATVATVVVPASDAEYNGDVTVGFTPEEKLSLEIVTAGTGAADMTAVARFT